MASLNKIQLIGNLGRDPEMRYTPQGTPITTFTIAVNRYWSDRDKNRQEETIWFRIEAWGRLADICNQYLSKGQSIYVEGRIKPLRMYTDREGKERCSLEVVANEMQMLGGGGSRGGGDIPPAYDETSDSSSSSGHSGRNQAQNIDSEDDIPF